MFCVKNTRDLRGDPSWNHYYRFVHHWRSTPKVKDYPCKIAPTYIRKSRSTIIRVICHLDFMPKKDKFHQVVEIALRKDGWEITDDPLFITVGGVDMLIDLGAERLLAAEKQGEKIAVEIKSFLNTSAITDFHLAVGQFINYRTALKIKDPQRQLFMAIPLTTYNDFFQREFAIIIIEDYQLALLVYDIEDEVIALWKK